MIIVFYYWYFNHGFKFQSSVCNGCDHLTMFCVNISSIAIIAIKGIDCRRIIHNISKSDAANLLENSVLVLGIYKKMHINEINIKNRFSKCYFDNSIKAKNLETKNILINEKNYKDLVIYFTKYAHNKSIKIVNLHYNELIGKTEEH